MASSTGKHVVVLLNRRAGTGAGHAKVCRLVESLQRHGLQTVTTESVAELKRRLDQQNGELHAVVAAGGDGTAELMARHTPADVPIGILPLGTENLLAKYLGLATDPETIGKAIAERRTRAFDAGSANGQIFLLMLSCGFDAEVVRRLHDERRGNITHLAYAMPILESIRNYDYPTLKVSWETSVGGESRWEETDCHWAFVFNLPSYAAGLQVVASADPTDGQLDIATFAGGSFWHGLWQFSAVLLGQQENLAGYEVRRARRLRIRSERDVPYQADGDPGGFLPVEIEVLPQRLQLIVKA